MMGDWQGAGMLRASGKGDGMSGNKKLHSPCVSGAAWRVTKMKTKKDREGNLLHGRDLGTNPELHPSSTHCKKHEQGVVKGTVSTPTPCTGAPLGSPAPTNHPVPVLCCSPGVPSAHTTPCPPAPVHPCSPWHPCTTPPPCSAAPHGPQHCGPMAAVPPPVRCHLLRAGQAAGQG